MSVGELRDMLLMLIGRLAGDVDGVEPRLDEKDMIAVRLCRYLVERGSERSMFSGSSSGGI